MTLLSVRPKVDDLIFGLFGRSLHPELFEIHATQKLQRDKFQAQIDITTTGHIVMFRLGAHTFTEFSACVYQPLPERRRLLTQKLSGSFEDHVECENGVHFHYHFDLERTTPTAFSTLQNAFENRSATQGLLHRFPSSNPKRPAAISYLFVETRANSLRTQAIHTFPEDLAILKTQSLFQLER